MLHTCMPYKKRKLDHILSCIYNLKVITSSAYLLFQTAVKLPKKDEEEEKL